MHSREWGGVKLVGQLTLEVPYCEATVGQRTKTLDVLWPSGH